MKRVVLMIVVSLVSLQACADPGAVADNTDFRVEEVVAGLKHPWGMTFLPGGSILVTERPGRLRVIEDGRLLPEPVAGLPDVRQQGQGGLMDVALHPEFENNRLVYLSYTAEGEDGYGTEVVRGRLNKGALENTEVIFRALPKVSGGRHFGSRLLFAQDGTLFITLGERGNRDMAQDRGAHPGSLIRINDDGSIPDDNPFVGKPGIKPEIYSWGHRNIQGIARQPGTDRIWTHEHGPQGGDEVNIIRAGANYGWPVITYGKNYGLGTSIGEGTHKEGMEQPAHYWVPSIAPSGMAFYTGSEFPQWQGNLFAGSLKFGELARLEVDGRTIINEKRLRNDSFIRIRDVRQGPDGYLYLLTDERNGRLLRLVKRKE